MLLLTSTLWLNACTTSPRQPEPTALAMTVRNEAPGRSFDRLATMREWLDATGDEARAQEQRREAITSASQIYGDKHPLVERLRSASGD